MKTLTKLMESQLANSDGKMVHFQAAVGGWKRLENPTMSTELKCLICEGTDHGVTIATPIGNSNERVWICHTRNCGSNADLKHRQATYAPTDGRRGVEWPLFCEMNNIGDKFHTVRFEAIEQSPEMKFNMQDFLKSEDHFMTMRGTKGTGKSYAGMGICELYTRTKISCMFISHAKMQSDWLDTFKMDGLNNFISRVKNVELLIIDDFGAVEPSDKFKAFFFDLIDSRMQWKGRKTIIISNLLSDNEEDERRYLKCLGGDAVSDRLKRAIKLKFKDKSRR